MNKDNYLRHRFTKEFRERMGRVYPYVLKTPDLCKMLGVSRQTLWTWEHLGKFTPPRMGTRGDRRFTIKQANQICKAFSPGGNGKWHFNPEVQEKSIS